MDKKFVPFTPETWESENKKNPDFDAGQFESGNRRFLTEAERRNKNLWHQAMNPDRKATTADIAHEEALLENEEFNATHEQVEVEPGKYEYRYTKEYQEWMDKLKVVVEKFKEKKEHLEGKGKDIKLAVLFMGGGMRGAYGAGVARALQRMGYGKYIDAIFGISAGAVYGAYLAGDQDVEASVYYEECCTKEFINTERLANMMGIDYLIDVISNGRKKLQQNAVMASKTKFIVQAVDNETGEPILIDAKTATTKEKGMSGLMASIYGSMRVPYFHLRGGKNKGISVNDKEVSDGGFDYMDFKKIIEKCDANTYLVVPNFSFSKAASVQVGKGKWWLGSITPDSLKKGSLGLVVKNLIQDEALKKFIERMEHEKNIDIAFAWAPNLGLNPLTNDPARVRNAVVKAGERVCKEFGEPKTELGLP